MHDEKVQRRDFFSVSPPPVIIDLKFFLAQAYRQTLDALEGRQTVAFLSVDGALIHIGAD